MTYLGKDDILNFSDKIMLFIETAKLENEYGNLILDYVEKLHLNGLSVLEKDIENEVYNFYHYIILYKDLLSEDEEMFIEKIVSDELNKKSNWT